MAIILISSSVACASYQRTGSSMAHAGGGTIGKAIGKKGGNSAVGATIGSTIGVSAFDFVYNSFKRVPDSPVAVPLEKSAKAEAVQRGRLYTVSGVGSGLTGGLTGNILKPKVSTTLGLDVALGKGSFFLYPSVELLVFGYNQQVPDADFSFSSEKTRATYSTFTLSLGYRKALGNFSIYQFAGLGGALVNEPRMTVDAVNRQTTLSSRKTSTWAAKGGVGFDYRLGQFVIFTEGSHLHNFKSMQNQKILVFPVYIGIKSNISGLLKSKELR